MRNKSSFYGETEPRWLLATAWLLILALPAITFCALRIDNSYQLIFIYSPVAGLVALVAAVRLRSWLLVLQGIFTATFYGYLTFLYFGLVP
ncbi:hypothetical protein [Corynebacterium sp. CCM 9204]|uniref:hypothetical protein n=1 Tax=Corynebacterium sp. CCM 9204 TaxID=3057616 RepID=UPI003524ACAD